MKTTLPLALVLCLITATLAFSQTAPPAGRGGAPADANAAQRLQLQQQVQPLQLELQSLQQRLVARYPGDLSPDQIQQRIQAIQQQLQPLQQQIQALGGGAGFGGGFGGRGGGRGGPITVPDNATPDQLRDVIQRLQQQNQQLAQQGRGAQPAREPAPPPCVPVNPNATQEAKDLLAKICAVSGKGILTGTHNFPNQRNLDTEAIHSTTGKYPAIWGSDFGFLDGEDKDAITHRNLMIEEAKRQYAAGSIIYLCWHMLRPTEDEPGKSNPGGTSESWGGSVQARLTDDQWLELITSDSPLHQRWEKYMDTAAGYLKQLQDAHIPVMWRPMHENNGTFFWWGGRPGQYGTAELYREVYNRMVNVHHLNNLVWVWNQNGPAPGGEFYGFYPGAKYCDIVSYDNYSTLDDRYYQEILTIANGKPIGFGEVGSPPPPEVLMNQPKLAFYMTWAGGGGGGRGAAQPTPTPVNIPPNATAQQLRQIIQDLRQQPAGGRGGRGGTAYPIPEGASTDMLRRIIERIQPGGNALKAIYDDPYYIKRGDPLPK
ncbi:MAG: glycosyl hydrolase [Bryobacteraceae bacterium]|jgi:mannan endo-1,4-beta-mannosidase